MNNAEETNQPFVSIVMITYGHEKYIEQAIKGVFSQRTNFLTELIIAEDCSPDNTETIVNKLLSTAPSNIIVNYIRHKKNIGASRNFLFALSKAKSKYLSLCEGDDYWTDSLKLQKQVDFLEKNADFNVTVGKIKKLYPSGKMVYSDQVNPSKQNIFTIKDYLKGNFSQTSTFLMRNNFNLPDWMSKMHAGDQSLMIIATGKGKIYYFDDFFSVYRIHDQSISAKANYKDAYINGIFFLQTINEYTNYQYKKIIKAKKVNNYLFYLMKKANNPIIDILLKIVMKINVFILRHA